MAGRAKAKAFPPEDLEIALLRSNNSIDAAAKGLIDMGRAENNVTDKRKGYSTRAQVRYVLQTCRFNEDLALWMLNNEKEMSRKTEFITKRTGLDAGLGFPTKQDIERLLVDKQGEEGPVMAELKRKWKLDIGSTPARTSGLSHLATPEHPSLRAPWAKCGEVRRSAAKCGEVRRSAAKFRRSSAKFTYAAGVSSRSDGRLHRGGGSGGDADPRAVRGLRLLAPPHRRGARPRGGAVRRRGTSNYYYSSRIRRGGLRLLSAGLS